MTPAELHAACAAARAETERATAQVLDLHKQRTAAGRERDRAISAAAKARDVRRDAMTQAALGRADANDAPLKRAVREADDAADDAETRFAALGPALVEATRERALRLHAYAVLATRLVALHVAAEERRARAALETVADALATRTRLTGFAAELAGEASGGASPDPFSHSRLSAIGQVERDILGRRGFRSDALMLPYAPAAFRMTETQLFALELPRLDDADRIIDDAPLVLPPRPLRAEDERDDAVQAVVQSSPPDPDEFDDDEDLDDEDEDDEDDAA